MKSHLVKNHGDIFVHDSSLMIYPLDKPNTKHEYLILKPHSTLVYTLKDFFLLLFFLSPLFKVYKKVVTQQKIFWFLVFSILIWYLAYPLELKDRNRPLLNKDQAWQFDALNF